MEVISAVYTKHMSKVWDKCMRKRRTGHVVGSPILIS